MSNSYVRLRNYGYRLYSNERGVISFEYMIVACCVVGIALAAFGGGATNGIGAALTSGLTAITAVVIAAV